MSHSKTLRPFQAQAIDTLWRGFKTNARQLCVLPTGSGKSFIITELQRRLAAVNYKSILLLNRELLVKQFLKDIPTAGVYAAGLNAREREAIITAAMIQSCYREKFEDVRVIFVDETHNLLEEGMYQDFILRHPEAKIVGFTATPYNQHGYIYGDNKFFPRRDYFRSLEAMVADGYLVPPVSVNPIPEQFKTDHIRQGLDDYVLTELEKLVSDKNKARSQVKDALARTKDRKKILWMCLNVEHAEMIRAEIKDACIVHSKMSKAKQEAERKAFEQGSCRHMVSVMMITEGYDYPPADALVMLRPTRSAKLYVQTVGRVLRLAEGKRDAKILDYGEIIKNLGSVYDPYVTREQKKKAIEENEQTIFFSAGIRLCPVCFTANPMKAKECMDCGHTFDNAVDRHLQLKAAEEEIKRIGTEAKISDVSLEQYLAKSGNNCVRVNFHSGPLVYSQYYTAHPFSWGQGRRVLKQLTGWDFETFQEAYDNLEQIIVENKPLSIMVKRDGRYEKITKINFT